jgi:hypothetical protein
MEWHGAEPRVFWCYLGAAPLHDPFYDMTVQRALQTPFNSLFAHGTDMDASSENNAAYCEIARVCPLHCSHPVGAKLKPNALISPRKGC